jgi:hypothetical protein
MTDGNLVEQSRDQADIYLDKVSDKWAKYIALHVGIFWCIGTFIIKNHDSVQIVLDDKNMHKHLADGDFTTDRFIIQRTKFIKQLFDQRELEISFVLEDVEKNLARKLL